MRKQEGGFFVTLVVDLWAGFSRREQWLCRWCSTSSWLTSLRSCVSFSVFSRRRCLRLSSSTACYHSCWTTETFTLFAVEMLCLISSTRRWTFLLCHRARYPQCYCAQWRCLRLSSSSVWWTSSCVARTVHTVQTVHFLGDSTGPVLRQPGWHGRCCTDRCLWSPDSGETVMFPQLQLIDKVFAVVQRHIPIVFLT